VLVALLLGCLPLLGERLPPFGELVQADHLDLVRLEQPLVGPRQAVEPRLELAFDRLVLRVAVCRLGNELLELGNQLLGVAEQADDVIPYRLLDNLGIDHRPRALAVTSRGQRIDAGAAVVAPLGPAGRPGETAAVDGQTADAALQEAAQEIVVLRVVAECDRGVACHLRLNALPRLLVHQ
jgi:hypothetical protein